MNIFDLPGDGPAHRVDGLDDGAPVVFANSLGNRSAPLGPILPLLAQGTAYHSDLTNASLDCRLVRLRPMRRVR